MAEHQLSGKVVVITGASSGFGKGAALEFAQRGASLVLAARRDEQLQEVVRECESRGARAAAISTDVSQQGDVQLLAQFALTEFNRIDVWVNNAGVGVVGRFEEVPLNDHVQVIETDLLGTFYGSYFAMRQFRRQGSGILINVASLLGKVPAPYHASYAAAKFGIVGLSAVLRQELEQAKVDGVHVCTVMPVSTDTPFFQHAGSYTGHEVRPIPPVQDPQEVIDTIVRLATNPKDEVAIGAAGKVMTLAHALAPGIIEKLMSRQTHKEDFEKAPPAQETSGNIRQPSQEGSGVRGGWRGTKAG
jgi:short-subunit dehydrogenase